MTTSPPITAVLGLHHVTAICTDPQRNLDFYGGVLGLRFVKRTVNFDDPTTYHFYYGDGAGTPGSILTFFPWPGARPGQIGSGQVAVTSFAAVRGSIGFWVERLIKHGVKFEGPDRRVGPGSEVEQTISFRDPDGLLLEIVGTDRARSRRGWDRVEGIPAEHALRGFHAVTLWVEDAAETERMLTDTLGFRATGDWGDRRRFSAGDGDSGTLIDVRTVGGFAAGTMGAGTVHHVAVRVADDPAQLRVRAQVASAGLQPTPVIDRQYFHSVYFRERGGVLFELATDPPGFAIDEPMDRLGERLMLPPQFERHRAQLEAALPPIHLGGPPTGAAFVNAGPAPEDVSGDALGFVHRYLPPEGGAVAGGTTLLLLHGTGGDEHDLVPLGRALLPGAGLLGLRGKVLERGMPRFFRRLAEGVFDQEDLARRTDELAEFIERAARTYELDPKGIVAVGFSNGANIAASLLLRRPGTLAKAVLLSPMVPFEPDPLPRLAGTEVFIGAGAADPIAPIEGAERLGLLLETAGARVTIHRTPGGHEVTGTEVEAARAWLGG
jgi:predicted esterase/catechol 2,3-dioxygenase-like lactoylglutathione lyase family enzyme